MRTINIYVINVRLMYMNKVILFFIMCANICLVLNLQLIVNNLKYISNYLPFSLK